MQFKDQEEQRIAKHEGWTIRGGFPARYFDSRGECPFSCITDIFKFFAHKGKTSEFHRRVYLEMPWNTIDQELARERGYQINYHGDLETRKRTREETEEDLKRDAAAGDPLAMKTILTITKRRLDVG